MTRAEILHQMRQSIQDKEPIIGVSIGNGRSAKQAENGGADMIAALNAGRFRMGGVSSTASLLPFYNSNDLVFEFATTEVIPRVKNIPVVFGACAQDPNIIDYHNFVRKLLNAGFHGINNFPTVSLIDGLFREALEEEGDGFLHEVKLMEAAVQEGMFTVAFAVTLEESIQMVKAGVDVLCLHFGWTYITRPPEYEIDRYVDNLIHRANVVFNEAKKINPNIIPMIYGGAIVQNQDVIKRFYEETDVVGYFGGSVFDTIPVEGSMQSATELFKNMNRVSLLEMENENLRRLLKKRERINAILGDSKEMKELISWMKKVSKYDANILIEGESGTGKDLVVRGIHYDSNRAIHPLKKVNCASIPRDIMETELFGHERGAFSGADTRQIGRLESANNGTLFLDNVDELDWDVQAKLLRVIQDGEFERLGGSETIKLNVRVVSTTSKDLKEEMLAGRFREDLYYLLTVLSRRIPPLRAHKQDIPTYISAFMKQITERHHTNVNITENVMNALMAYDWPGNVRELKNVLERGVILCENNLIDLTCLPGSFGEFMILDDNVNYIKNSSMLIEKELILSELIKHNWNQTKVADQLGITRRTLYNKLKKYGISKK